MVIKATNAACTLYCRILIFLDAMPCNAVDNITYMPGTMTALMAATVCNTLRHSITLRALHHVQALLIIKP